MKLAERLRERLEICGISQSELARRADLTQGTIGGLLSGRSRSSAHLHRIARELGTTPAYLTGETDDPTANAPAPPELDREEIALIEMYRSVGDADRAAVVQLLRSLALIGQQSRTIHDQRLDYGGEADARPRRRAAA